jgi:hypothetical protein
MGLYFEPMAIMACLSRSVWLVVAVSILAILNSCGGGDLVDGPGRSVVTDAKRPGPIAMLPQEGFIFGEQDTGKIRFVDGEGRLQVEAVAEVATDDAEDGGVRGLVVDIGERIYASSGRTVAWSSGPSTRPPSAFCGRGPL